MMLYTMVFSCERHEIAFATAAALQHPAVLLDSHLMLCVFSSVLVTPGRQTAFGLTDLTLAGDVQKSHPVAVSYHLMVKENIVGWKPVGLQAHIASAG